MPGQAVVVSVAEAVKIAIEEARNSFCLTDFALDRNYADWKNDLLNADGLRVDVVGAAANYKLDQDDLESLAHIVPVRIAVRQRLGEEDQDDSGHVLVAKVDELLLLTQQLFVMFTPARLADEPSAAWQETKILAAPVKDHLETAKQFTSVVQVTFEAAL